MKERKERAESYGAPQIELIELVVEQGFVTSVHADGYIEDDGTW